MDSKDVKVVCPCCESRLEIDVRLVLRVVPRDESRPHA